MAGIKFDFAIGDENFKQKMNDIRQSVSETARVMQRLSSDGIDVSTLNARIKAVEGIIKDNEQVIAQNMKTLQEYGKEAEKLYKAGDYSTFDTVTKDMEAQANVLKYLIQETDGYKNVLEQLNNMDLSHITDELESQKDASENAQKEGTKWGDIIRILPAPLRNVANGIQSIFKAIKAVMATGWGAAIGVVAGALGTLMTYLKGSAEGQMKLAKATGYVKGAFVQVKEGVIQAGKKMVDAFKDPQKAIDDLWAKIKQNFVTRLESLVKYLKGFGELMKDVFTGNWSELGGDLKDIGNAAVDIFTGVENTVSKVSDKLADVNDKAKEYADLDVRQRQNDIARVQLEKKLASMEEEQAEQREKMYSTETSIAEKREAVKRSQELISQRYAEQIRLAQEDLAIAQQRAKLSTNKQEVLDDIAHKEAEVIRLQAEEQKEQAALARRSATFARQELQEAQNLIDFKRKTMEEELSLVNDSYDKRMKAAELAYQKEKDEIEKQKEQMMLQGGGKLTFEQMMALGDAMRVATEKYKKAQKDALEDEEDAMNDYLIKWGTTEEKRLATKEKYEKLMAKAGTEGQRKAYEKEMGDALITIEMQAKNGSSIISKMFMDMKKTSLKNLKDIKKQGKDLIDMLNSGQYDEEKGTFLGVDKELFEDIVNNPEKLESIVNAFKKIEDQIEKVQSPLDNIIDGFEDLFNAGGDRNKTLEALNQITSATKTLNEGAGFVADTMASIGTAINNEGLKTAADTIKDIAGVIDSAGQGAAIGGQIGGGYGAIIGAAVGLGKGMTEMAIKNADKELADFIEDKRKEIRQIAIENEEVLKKINSTYGTDRSKNLEKQNELLRQQAELVEQQMQAEQSKKNTDQSALEGYEDELRNINNQINENKEAAIDAIIGNDISSSIEDFTSKYIAAWEAGESKAMSVKEFVSDMLKSTVKEAIKTAVESSKQMVEIRNKVAEYMADGIIESWEKKDIEDRAEALQQKIDEKFGWADEIMSDNVSISGTTGRTLSTMTQETGEALEGRFTAVQMSVNEISARVIEGVTVLQAILSVSTSQNDNLSDILTQITFCNGYLEDIAKYTLAISKWKSNIDDITDSIEGL